MNFLVIKIEFLNGVVVFQLFNKKSIFWFSGHSCSIYLEVSIFFFEWFILWAFLENLLPVVIGINIYWKSLIIFLIYWNGFIILINFKLTLIYIYRFRYKRFVLITDVILISIVTFIINIVSLRDRCRIKFIGQIHLVWSILILVFLVLKLVLNCFS